MPLHFADPADADAEADPALVFFAPVAPPAAAAVAGGGRSGGWNLAKARRAARRD